MLKDMFAIWQRQSDLMKLQYAYAVVVLVTLVAAGLVGLLNQTVARQVLGICGIAAIAFVVNLISFALINLLADGNTSRSQKQPRSRR
jgi:hypothetical protein